MSYSNPPHQETIIDLAFAPVPNFDPVRYLRLHSKLREQYGESQSQPALPPIQSMPDTGMAFILGFGDGPPPTRIWHLSIDQRMVLQLQSDRLILNWRRIDDPNWETYPGYDALIMRFLEAYDLLRVEVLQESGQELEPIRCEFAYDNVITHSVSHAAGGISKVISGVSEPITGANEFGTLTSLGMMLRYDFCGDSLGSSSTLVNLQPAFDRSTGEAIHGLRIACAGPPVDSDRNGLHNAFSEGHEKALKTFESITDDEVQRSSWGRS